jgi:hypothetical protein
MSTVFTNDPIKVNIISKKNTIKQTIIFIGIVPNDIKLELQKIESSDGKNVKSGNPRLCEFYGRDWAKKLGIVRNTKKVGIAGGDEFSFDSVESSNNIKIENQIEESNIISEIAQESPKNQDSQNDMLNKITTSVHTDDFIPEPPMDGDDLITFDELDADDDIIDETDISEKTSQITEISETSDNKLGIRFIFSDPYLSVYPEDKVIEFKKKIYTILEIPIFRQHIWYVYQGRTYPLSYSIFRNTSLLYVNIQDMLTKYNEPSSKSATQQLVENIPVSTKFYQMKNSLKVTTLDTFSILDEYYHKYGITEYNLLDLDDFIKPSRKALVGIINDRYQLELIYYSFIMIYWPMLSLHAFLEYIKSEDRIPKYYPDLQQPIPELKQIFKLEKHIMDTKADLITNPAKRDSLKSIRGNMTNSIVYSILSVLTYKNNKDELLFIRNLFDKFPLSDRIISSKCYMMHNSKKITLSKAYKANSYITEIIDLDSIMFRISVSMDTIKTISLIFYKNGNYIIKSTWPEEDHNDFDDIYKIVDRITKPVVEKINLLGSYVLSNKKTIPFMTKTNTKFTEIGMSMFYKKTLTGEQFEILKSIMTDYRKAGIVLDKMSEKSTAEYYFSKGMYKFQPNRIERVITINNYYDFLTDGIIKQKWFTIFKKTRITKLHHRFSDIKIEIVGIKENEFFIFYNFIMTLFHIYNTQLKHKNATQTHKKQQDDYKNINERKLKKTLRNLKEQDPILYNFKKLYKTENVYSKICQKPYQPLLLNKQAYDQLHQDKKKNAIKYWNFTTNKDAYYVCPNPKFPYIKFIIKRHPKDYCIPCCKKNQISANAKDAKRIIYDMCIKDHKYTPAERTITMGSRYIMSYGKDVEPGRLSRLPEDSLEPLFYETYSIKEQGIDQECITEDGYYLYGLHQHANNIKNVGVLNILMHATESNLIEFVGNIIKIVKNTPNKFAILLNGEIHKYFTSLDHFTSSLHNMFLTPNKLATYSDDIPWNVIFIDIAYLFLNINIIQFKHKKSENVKLILPSYISNKEQFLSPEFKNLIIFKKRNKYYPIYLLNTIVFFKVKMFTKKIFNYNDSITIIIGRMVESYFNEQIKKKIIDNINLSIIIKFVECSKYTISKLFINITNMCYYVHLKSKSGKNIYIPIELSYHLETGKRDVTYTVFSRQQYKMSIDTMLKFIKDFNNWIAVKSEKAGMRVIGADKSLPLEKQVQPIYPYITISKWLVLTPFNKKIHSSSKVIGFISHNVNYYVSDINLSQALKINKTKLIQVFYDPDIINTHIHKKVKAYYDNRCAKIGKSIYSSNLYQLVLLEFMTIFNQNRNTSLRQKIKKTLLGNFNKDFDELMEDISILVTDCDDYYKIKAQICEFVNNHHSKNILFKEIDDSFYKFDRDLFERIKKLPRGKLYKELEKISHKFIKYGNVNNIKDFDFPNMYVSCQSRVKNKNEKYCTNNKLIINKKRLHDILEIMTADILNPVKEKWLFSSIFSDKVITFLKFIKRPDELITIQIDD